MTSEEKWDKIAKWWNEYRNKPMEEVADFLKGKDGRILDLACGTGRHFPLMNGTIYGVDFSSKMLEIAEINAEKANLSCILIKSEARELPFEDDFFDNAIFIAGLHCIEGTDKREKSLKELERVLKKKGKALISVWSKNHKLIMGITGEIIIPWKLDGKNIDRYYYIYQKEEIEKEIVEAGFKILRIWENDNIWIEITK